MNKEKVQGIIRAYEDGVTLPAVSQLFKVTYEEIISIIHAYKIGRKRR